MGAGGRVDVECRGETLGTGAAAVAGHLRITAIVLRRWGGGAWFAAQRGLCLGRPGYSVDGMIQSFANSIYTIVFTRRRPILDIRRCNTLTSAQP